MVIFQQVPIPHKQSLPLFNKYEIAENKMELIAEEEFLYHGIKVR